MNRPNFFRLALAAVVAVLGWTSVASAQPGRGRDRDRNPEHRIERLSERLDLTETQQADLRAFWTEQREAVEAWREANPNATRDERHAFMETQREAAHAKLETLLTAEQLEQLKADGPRRGRRGGPGFGVRGLDLSDEQQTQLRALMQEQRETMRTWHDANPDATREERHAFRETQREAMHSALENVLTAEQLRQLEERRTDGVRQGHRGRRGGGPGFGARDLDLSDAQQEQAHALRDAHRDAMEAWREANPNATRDERHAFMEAQREQMKAAFEALLTPEQLDTVRARQAEFEARRETRRRHRRGDDANTPSGAASAESATPERATRAFELSNYPNPFNPSTEIRFTLPEAATVSLVVYDVQGRAVGHLIDGRLNAGSHSARFDAADLPTGAYLYRLTVDGVTETGRMLLTK